MADDRPAFSVVEQAQLQQAVAFLHAGQLEQSRALCQALLKTNSRQPDALHILGILAHQSGRLDDARRLIAKAISVGAPKAIFHSNLGNVLQDLQRPRNALESYDRALALQPDLAATHYNRALVLDALGRYGEAVDAFDRAIALDGGFAAAHFDRGNALVRHGRRGEALGSYQRAVALDPGHTEARKSILWLAITDPSPDTDLETLITETCAATVAAEANALVAAGTIPTFRVHHDAEQSAYLLAQGHEDMRQAHEALKGIAAREAHGGEFQLLDSEIATINHARGRVLRQEVGDDLTHLLNPGNDWAALEKQYLSGTPEVVVIDELLTGPALLALRRFCLASTVWRSEYDNHYLGAFAADGFVNPLLLRIAEELRERMPRIFFPHPLEQLWAFKYDSRMRRGINVHADFARVNLNFWITPDEANLDPSSGGLVVYDVPAPTSWTFQEYNNDSKRIHDFLKTRRSKKRVVPYRCNRAVLFNSNLFHETDAIHFKEGYENRRINITYLFGRGPAGEAA